MELNQGMTRNLIYKKFAIISKSQIKFLQGDSGAELVACWLAVLEVRGSNPSEQTIFQSKICWFCCCLGR
jgi:hypothetical protein